LQPSRQEVNRVGRGNGPNPGFTAYPPSLFDIALASVSKIKPALTTQRTPKGPPEEPELANYNSSSESGWFMVAAMGFKDEWIGKINASDVLNHTQIPKVPTLASGPD
jgi:hypothetical protein